MVFICHMVFKIKRHFWFNFLKIQNESIWFFLSSHPVGIVGIGISKVGVYATGGIWKSIGEMSIGDWAYWGHHSGGACKDSRISFSISVTLLPLCLNSLSFSLNRLGDNKGISMISIAIRVESVESVGVWESMVVGVGDSWSLNLNSFDCRLHNWCSVDIRIGQIVGISLGISLGLTFLPLSLNSLSFGFSLNRLGDNQGISMIPKSVRVDSMVTKVVWVSVGVGKSRCLNFHLLYNRLNKWGGVNIWVVKTTKTMKTICQIVGISLSISLSIGLTLPPFGSLHSGSLSLSGSSGSSGEWDGERESMSPETIVSMMIRIAVGEEQRSSLSLNLSGLHFNRLDDRSMGDCMVSSESIEKGRVDEELRISLSIC